MIRPTAYFRVVLPIIAPIAARPGEFVALWLTHPDHSLTVISRDRTTVLRSANAPHGRVSGDLLHLCLDGAIMGLSSADEAVLRGDRPAA